MNHQINAGYQSAVPLVKYTLANVVPK